MKVSSFCAPCKAKRFYDVTCLSTKDEGKRKRTMAAVLASIGRAMEEKDCPSFAGTKQSEAIIRATGNKDPYRKQKLEVIKKARRIYPEFERWILGGKTPYERFRKAAVLAIAGNALELSAPNHRVELAGLKGEMWRLVKSGLAADDVKRIFKRIRSCSDVLYLCDNCGEAVFDRPLISELKQYAHVTIGVASVPMDEDVSVKEAKAAGLCGLAPIIGKGRTYGVWKERAPRGFWKKLEGADFVIAKGMANYETLTEYPKLSNGRVACLLMVKCEPVGRSLGLAKGSLAAKIL
jgi:uncharacterized protein with ATP-grasp and redox domains